MSHAKQLTTDFNSYSSLQEQQQQYQQQQAAQQCRLSLGNIKVCHGATSLEDHRHTLTNPLIAETLQPAAALALAVLRCADKFRGLAAVPKAAKLGDIKALM